MDLEIVQSDTLVIQNPNGGYDLYIRKKPDINCVLLTESTKDYVNNASNYAYRDKKFNPVNGAEKRLLNGKFLPPEKKIYSLIDSTPELNTPLGEAFHIWIPFVVKYGYPWTRHGEEQVLDGTYLNIRSFEKPYGDYEGAFKDNPFVLRLTQKPISVKQPQDEIYMDSAVKSFSGLAENTDGKMYYAKGPEDIVPLINRALKRGNESALQLVFVIDATYSMHDDIKEIRQSIKPLMEKTRNRYQNLEVGAVLYKDYTENFLTKQVCNFTEDLDRFYDGMNSFKVGGGKDLPEAVYEGIHQALSMNWKKNKETKRVIILVGDAPPHPIPRGEIGFDTVDRLALKNGVSIYPIILPHGKTR